MTVGALVLPRGTVGNTEASTTRRPGTPYTRSSGSTTVPHGFDPDAYCMPGDIAGLLDRDWTDLVNETRPRTAPAPAGTHHTRGTVLRARRTPASSAPGVNEGRR